MTGVLGLLGAPRQRSASNLSVARQARPSGSVMKITLISLPSRPAVSQPCALGPWSLVLGPGPDHCVSPCPYSSCVLPSAYGSVGIACIW